MAGYNILIACHIIEGCKMKYLLLSGSFHRQSKSLAILKAMELFLVSDETKIANLEALPFYSEDLNDPKPESIKRLLSDIQQADGLIVCTPEYNHSVPAVLKNAIDWASRPAFNSVLKSKPVTIITQADSTVGGARAQAHLKLILDSTLSKIHPCHEMMIPHVSQLFTNDMTVDDKKVLSRLQRHVKDFEAFIQNIY